MRKKLLDLLRMQPFKPIRLRSTNDTTHVIRHPDQVLVTPSYVEIGVPVNDAPGPEVASTVFVSIIHIVQVDAIDAPTPSNTNGAP
jgi:hypothetical protein